MTKTILFTLFMGLGTILLGHGNPIVETFIDVEASSISWVGKKVTGAHEGTISLKSGALDFDASHYNIANQSEGWMTMSYGSEQLEDITEDEVLFEIVVKAENNIDVAEVFKIASSVTQAEAYRGHFDIVNVDLKPRALKESKILSINPNPWISSCNIEFSLAEDADGIWEFYDVNGRLIYSKQAAYKSGTHIMHVNRENLNTTGIVYIKFSSAQSVFESRMMIVD